MIANWPDVVRQIIFKKIEIVLFCFFLMENKII